MVGLILRLDRARLAVWVGVTAAVIIGSAASLPAAYPDQAAIDAYALMMGSNPALAAFAGPGYGLDSPNIGVILVNEVQLWGLVTVGLMSVFLVNRHTRAEEDAGRADLLRSAVVGHHTVSVATVAVVTGAHVVLATACAVGFVLVGYPGRGSIALALSYLFTGWMFAGVALVAAQLAGTGRGSLGLASSTLGLAFVVRAVGDTTGSPVRWLSPSPGPRACGPSPESSGGYSDWRGCSVPPWWAPGCGCPPGGTSDRGDWYPDGVPTGPGRPSAIPSVSLSISTDGRSPRGRRACSSWALCTARWPTTSLR